MVHIATVAESFLDNNSDSIIDNKDLYDKFNSNKTLHIFLLNSNTPEAISSFKEKLNRIEIIEFDTNENVLFKDDILLCDANNVDARYCFLNEDGIVRFKMGVDKVDSTYAAIFKAFVGTDELTEGEPYLIWPSPSISNKAFIKASIVVIENARV